MLSRSSTASREWLALGPASRLLGVDPDTLRRWADEGRVVAYVTPGGHRRFDRRALDRLVTAKRGPGRRPLAIIGATPARLSRAYRRSYPPGGPLGSSTPLSGPERDAFREEGRGLVEALLGYLDAETESGRGEAVDRAAGCVDGIARQLAAAGTSLTESVAAFVAARRPFLAELGDLAARRDLDPAALASLYEAASSLLDRLLLRLISTHQERRIDPWT